MELSVERLEKVYSTQQQNAQQPLFCVAWTRAEILTTSLDEHAPVGCFCVLFGSQTEPE